MVTARELACTVLVQVMDEGAMSHIALREALDQATETFGMEGRDRRFATALVQGTLERLLLLDAKINGLSKTPVKKMKPWIRELLRMSTDQLLFLPEIPASAVCNVAVKLAQKRKFHGLKGFVNGILRNISRDPSLPDVDDSARYSQQEWLVHRWEESFGREQTEIMMQAFFERRPLAVRRNTSIVNADTLYASWERDGLTAEPVPYVPDAWYLKGFESIDRTEAFRKGWIQVQDVSSMLAAVAAAPEKGASILDLCAAPGGKSMHLADLTGSGGSVLARDLTENKTRMIRENRERAGFTWMKVEEADARVLDEDLIDCMDVVMADLPCSGLGTMGHKPEIRYRITPEAIRELAALQREILAQAWRYVKPGGVLVYSTCTITPEENQENFYWIAENTPLIPESLDAFLPEALHSETTAKGYLQLLPGIHKGCDGFFISRFRKLER